MSDKSLKSNSWKGYMLFDLEKDPYERFNIAKQNSNITEQISNIFLQFLNSTRNNKKKYIIPKITCNKHNAKHKNKDYQIQIPWCH